MKKNIILTENQLNELIKNIVEQVGSSAVKGINTFEIIDKVKQVKPKGGKYCFSDNKLKNLISNTEVSDIEGFNGLFDVHVVSQGEVYNKVNQGRAMDTDSINDVCDLKQGLKVGDVILLSKLPNN